MSLSSERAFSVDSDAPPRDFSAFEPERALKWTFHAEQRKWSSREVMVRIDTEPFGRGSYRLAYHLLELPAAIECVAKVSLFIEMTNENRKTVRESYFRDAWIQIYANEFAKHFNKRSVPKKVEFIDAWALELLDRDNQPVCAVEPYLPGVYIKHNNNNGFVENSVCRNTPQAFSHFTFEFSKEQLLICDIQGVNDIYTDPQIHSYEHRELFGDGNLGPRGIARFLASHKCNPICKHLGLLSIQDKEDEGTVPFQGTEPDFTKSVDVPCSYVPPPFVEKVISNLNLSNLFRIHLLISTVVSAVFCDIYIMCLHLIICFLLYSLMYNKLNLFNCSALL